jgi:hypothetical protein
MSPKESGHSIESLGVRPSGANRRGRWSPSGSCKDPRGRMSRKSFAPRSSSNSSGGRYKYRGRNARAIMRGIIQNDPHSLALTGNHNKSFALNEASPYVLARILDGGDRPTTLVDGAHRLIEKYCCGAPTAIRDPRRGDDVKRTRAPKNGGGVKATRWVA